MVRGNRFAWTGLGWAICGALAAAEPVRAQTTNLGEFITSSSPLPDGSRVTATLVRDAAGNFVPQAAVSPAAVPPAVAMPATLSTAPVGTGVAGSVTPPSFVTGGAPAGTAVPGYMTKMPSAEQMAIIQTAPTSAVPSLGFPGTKVGIAGSGAGHSCACGLLKGCGCCTKPRPTGQFPPPQQTMRLPDGQLYPYPSLAGTPGSSVPNAAAPPATPLSHYNPSQPNQPLISMQNLPPGTYNGKGVFGHPAQYIDGQPMRNLFRFMFN